MRVVKKVIQVPMDAELLDRLDRLSRSQKASRSELIREACREMLRRIEEEEMDRIYEEGYRRIPESPDWGRLGVQMVAERLKDEEPW